MLRSNRRLDRQQQSKLYHVRARVSWIGLLAMLVALGVGCGDGCGSGEEVTDHGEAALGEEVEPLSEQVVAVGRILRFNEHHFDLRHWRQMAMEQGMLDGSIEPVHLVGEMPTALFRFFFEELLEDQAGLLRWDGHLEVVVWKPEQEGQPWRWAAGIPRSDGQDLSESTDWTGEGFYRTGDDDDAALVPVFRRQAGEGDEAQTYYVAEIDTVPAARGDYDGRSVVVSNFPEGAAQLGEAVRLTGESGSGHAELYVNRPEFRKIYRSGMAVEYRPITELQRAQLPTWQMQVGATDGEEIREEDQILLASIYSFSGSFDSPTELSDTARTHQILKDAHFSFRLSDRGKVSDIKIHPPTNPLARSSLEEIVRLLTESHPVLPDDAVEPGDTWSQEITIRVNEDTTVLTQDAELTYTFNGWTRCGQTYCARIDVEQSLNAAGRYVVRHIETQSSADGSGSGWFLFDPERGRIVRSHWNIDSQGRTNTRRRTDEGTMRKVVDIRFNLSVESTTRLLERSPATYQLVPVDDQD